MHRTDGGISVDAAGPLPAGADRAGAHRHARQLRRAPSNSRMSSSSRGLRGPAVRQLRSLPPAGPAAPSRAASLRALVKEHGFRRPGLPSGFSVFILPQAGTDGAVSCLMGVVYGTFQRPVRRFARDFGSAAPARRFSRGAGFDRRTPAHPRQRSYHHATPTGAPARVGPAGFELSSRKTLPPVAGETIFPDPKDRACDRDPQRRSTSPGTPVSMAGRKCKRGGEGGKGGMSVDFVGGGVGLPSQVAASAQITIGLRFKETEMLNFNGRRWDEIILPCVSSSPRFLH
jgi:hypothetical protein